MSKNWITTGEAAAIISKNSHHSVTPHYVQTLVNEARLAYGPFMEGRHY